MQRDLELHKFLLIYQINPLRESIQNVRHWMVNEVISRPIRNNYWVYNYRSTISDVHLGVTCTLLYCVRHVDGPTSPI